MVFAFILIFIGGVSLGKFMDINNIPFTLTNYLWFLISCIVLIVGFVKMYRE